MRHEQITIFAGNGKNRTPYKRLNNTREECYTDTVKEVSVRVTGR